MIKKKCIDLINNIYDLDFDDLRDSCFEGDKEKLNHNLSNINLQNEEAYFYLNSLNLRIQKLTKFTRAIQNR